MRIHHLLALAVFAGAGGASQAATLVGDSFDSGVDGWQAVNGATGLSFVASGGDSGGYIAATDSSLAKIWFWQAPSSFLGDLSTAFGGSVSFALQSSRVTTGGQSYPDVRIVGNGVTLAADAGPNPGLTWTPYSVSLTPGVWHLNDLSGALASAADIHSALSNVSSFQIRGDYSPLTRGATTGLDSVVVSDVPEPQTWAMWLGGLLAVGSLARRRRG